MQSLESAASGLHVAVIMDGNGRWAQARGLPRARGHEAGLKAVRRTAEAAADLGVRALTLFAFASANWKRPRSEVDHLMRLFRVYLRRDLGRLVESGARLTVIGRRDRLPADLRAQIVEAEAATAGGRRLHLRVAIDYSAREAIARAAAAGLEPGLLGRLIAQSGSGDHRLDEVDLLIRTGGEQRLSDFLLWEAAFAELWFTDRMWPDFGADDLACALEDFSRRQRRFGGLPQAEPVVHAA